MDARTGLPSGSGARSDGSGAAIRPPLSRFLDLCHGEIAGDNSGAVASYIPELAKADPDHFGISVATTDGYVYEVGHSAVPFTIQSISKAFVFALALKTVGAKRVESLIGVEPSGDAFNSIRLRATIVRSIRWSMRAPLPARASSTMRKAVVLSIVSLQR